MASIEKRVSKNGDVSYRIKCSLGFDIYGNRIIKRMTFKPEPEMTEKQIQKELNRQAILFEEECKQEQEHMPGDSINRKVTFRELSEEWLDLTTTTKSQKISSIERLKGCRERLYKVFGDIDISKVNFRMIQRFILELSKDGANQTTGGGLSEKTQKHYLWFISDIMKYAIRCGLITDNPCRNVTVVKTEDQERPVYSLDELKDILSALENEAPLQYQVYFSLTAYLGLRRGEVLGLEFKEFDFQNSTVHIVRTSNYRNKATGTYTGTPKTKSSRRTLYVPQKIGALVDIQKRETETQRRKCGDQWIDTDRLFITWNGEPMHPNTPYTWLQRFCEARGLSFKGLHSFRHAFATQTITNGVDISTVSSLLGHSQTSTTLNIYTHSVQTANAKAINAFSELLENGV